MQACRRITRKSASNLALAFVLLPRNKRDAMAALYAFCRKVDDASDDEQEPLSQRRDQLASWREDIRTACAGGPPRLAVNREFQPVIAEYRLPFELFDELIQGVEMDLDVKRYQNYEDLYLYCYRVASVVGLLSIEIFGYRDPACKQYAVHLGKALQLTNILRDVRSDAERGRIYLPLSELNRFQVSEDEILQSRSSDRFRALAASVGERARGFYRQARQILPEADRRTMATAELMGSVYWRLLQKIENSHYNMLAPSTIRLSKLGKIQLILSAWLRLTLGHLESKYGD